jgi:hypothetical protein
MQTGTKQTNGLCRVLGSTRAQEREAMYELSDQALALVQLLPANSRRGKPWRYDLKLWTGTLHESATYPPA